MTGDNWGGSSGNITFQDDREYEAEGMYDTIRDEGGWEVEDADIIFYTDDESVSADLYFRLPDELTYDGSGVDSDLVMGLRFFGGEFDEFVAL